MATMMVIVRTVVFRRLYLVMRSRSRRSIVQLFIEKVLIGLTFFVITVSNAYRSMEISSYNQLQVFHHVHSNRNLLLVDGRFKREKWVSVKKEEDGDDG